MNTSAPSTRSSPSFSPPAPRSWFGDVVLVAFLCAQVADGVFTYLGVAVFGLSEGNPLIAFYMHHLGVGPSLTAAKLVAIGCSFVLHTLGFHRILGVLTVLYMSLAVLPWSFLLFVMH